MTSVHQMKTCSVCYISFNSCATKMHVQIDTYIFVEKPGQRGTPGPAGLSGAPGNTRPVGSVGFNGAPGSYGKHVLTVSY